MISALLLLLLAPAGFADEFDERTVWAIRQDFKEGCIKRMKPYLVTVGNNGNRGVSWYVDTCEGLFEYAASHTITPVLPAGSQRYEIKRIQQIPSPTPGLLKELFGDKKASR